MPGWPIRKNDSGGATLVFPIYDNVGDLVTAAAALDSERSIDQGTFTDCTNEASEIATSSAVYSLVLTQAEINGDEIAVITKTTTTDAKTAVNVIYTSTRNIDDLAYPTTSGRAIDVTAAGEVGLDLDNTVGTLAEAQFATGFMTAAKYAAGANDAAALATDAVNEIRDAILSDSNAFAGADIATIVTQTANVQRALVAGTSDSGTTTTMVDAARTEGDTDYFLGAWLVITNGTLQGQARKISAFTPASDTITVERAFTQAVATHTYEIWSADFPNNFSALVIESDGMAHADLKEWLGIAPLALVSQRVNTSVGAMAAAVLTAAAIGTDAFDADALAADAANEIADAILSRDLDNVEGTAALHSLLTACLKSVSRTIDNAGSLETYRTDGTTLHMAQALTTDVANDPIDSVAVGT